jgi:hypothetical protein
MLPSLAMEIAKTSGESFPTLGATCFDLLHECSAALVLQMLQLTLAALGYISFEKVSNALDDIDMTINWLKAQSLLCDESPEMSSAFFATFFDWQTRFLHHTTHHLETILKDIMQILWKAHVSQNRIEGWQEHVVNAIETRSIEWANKSVQNSRLLKSSFGELLSCDPSLTNQQMIQKQTYESCVASLYMTRHIYQTQLAPMTAHFRLLRMTSKLALGSHYESVCSGLYEAV